MLCACALGIILKGLSADYYSLQVIRREETEYAKAPEESREQCHALANVHMAQCPTQVAPSQEPVTTPLVEGCLAS